MTHRIVEFSRDVLGVKLHNGQAEALSNYYESGCQSWLLLAGRRSGKSLISDVIACYEAMVPEFPGVLRPGEERYILIVSVRLDNAQLHIRNIAKMLKHTRGMGATIKAQTNDRLELSNGVTILSMPASARAGRGYTASTLIFDELAHFVDSLGNSAAEPVFNALVPTIATFGDMGKIVITTTPAARVGIVYELWDRINAGELPDFHATKAPTRDLNPKVSERVINNALKRDVESATTEYFAEFSDPLANYFSTDVIDNAIDKRLRRVEKPTGRGYVMAIDPATMKDRYAFGICHREENGQIILDYALALRPPIDPNEAEGLLMDLRKRFSPRAILCDTASTVQRLKGDIPELEYTPFTRPMKLRIYGSLKEALNLGQLVLYPESDLIDELKSLQIRNGNDIAAPKSGRITHDDLADVLAMCVDALVSGTYTGEVMSAPPELLDWLEIPRGSDPWVHPHPPGVTWRNCKHRMAGCQACVDELEHDPETIAFREYEEKKYKDPSFQPTSFEEAQRRLFENRGFIPHPEEQSASRTERAFWKTIREKKG